MLSFSKAYFAMAEVDASFLFSIPSSVIDYDIGMYIVYSTCFYEVENISFILLIHNIY